MKKLAMVMAVLLMSVFSASAALYMKVDPSVIAVPIGGTVMSTVTVLTSSVGVPVPNRTLNVALWCKETGGDPLICDAGDIMSTSEITVSVDSRTNATGQAMVTIHHNGVGDGGIYHYRICDAQNGGVCQDSGASVTGDANTMVPEFSVVGAALVLVGAGLFVAKRRK